MTYRVRGGDRPRTDMIAQTRCLAGVGEAVRVRVYVSRALGGVWWDGYSRRCALCGGLPDRGIAAEACVGSDGRECVLLEIEVFMGQMSFMRLLPEIWDRSCKIPAEAMWRALPHLFPKAAEFFMPEASRAHAHAAVEWPTAQQALLLWRAPSHIALITPRLLQQLGLISLLKPIDCFSS